MKTPLNQLLDDAEVLIAQIQTAREAIDNHRRAFAGNSLELDHPTLELDFAANELQARIKALRGSTPHTHDPVAAATVLAIDNLLKLLTEAKGYFDAGKSLAALGTLVLFDDHADDLRAAFRLCQMAQRRSR